MKNVDEIIQSYKADWHIVEGLYLLDMQKQPESEILAILENSEWKDIIIEDKWDDDDVRDGQDWKYSWSADPDFDIWKYL